jgi:hypothetical protein
MSSFQLLGPFNAKGLSGTPSRDRIFTCNPAKDKSKAPEACAKEIFSTLAKRAYRRPVTNDDIAELMQYYADGVKQGGFEAGIREGITGTLASPFFLYRGERVPAGLKAGEKYAITDLELASKLSFFLWNSIPDDELLDIADQEQTQRSRDARQAGPAHAGRSCDRRRWRAISCISGWT